jgi:O-succinylbenzoic acid--CoA ligase
MEPTGASTPEWLSQRARLTPARRALRCGARWLTFAELDRLVSATAQALAAAGVRAGDRVAVLAPNGLDLVRLIHAVPRCGAVVVPLHPRWTAREVAGAVRDCAPSLVVHDEGSAAARSALADVRATTPGAPIAALMSEGPDAIDAGSRVDRLALSSIHSIVYTSGTSGEPKGVELTFGNHLWSAFGSALNLGLRDDDCWLACLPLCHVGGLAILLRGVVYGIPVVLHERFDAAAVTRDVDAGDVTIVSVVATMLQQLLNARPADRPYPRRLRCVLLGGGPTGQDLLDACARRGVPIVPTYGLTEAASQVTACAPAERPGPPGSAGKPLFPTEVRIADDDGRALPAGACGEILVRGPTVMRGYHGRTEETATALREGWLHTGDLGYLDGDGNLYVRDRRDGVIISGGENVYASEVEDVLRTHPAVLDAGVTGAPDARWGQAVVATVALRNGAAASEDDLLAYCRGRLAPFKVPKRVRFAETVPRSEGGKLRRRALRDGERSD